MITSCPNSFHSSCKLNSISIIGIWLLLCLKKYKKQCCIFCLRFNPDQVHVFQTSKEYLLLVFFVLQISMSVAVNHVWMVEVVRIMLMVSAVNVLLASLESAVKLVGLLKYYFLCLPGNVQNVFNSVLTVVQSMQYSVLDILNCMSCRTLDLLQALSVTNW